MVVWSVILPVASAATRGERITDFESDIEIRPDASILVKEEITVNVTGESINHGIFRDIPTKYKDRLNNSYSVGLKIVSVERDGYPEPYEILEAGNGKRIKIGSPYASIDPGIHAYSIAYEATRELGFFKNYDELYWNVIGNGWQFPIENASAVIYLPSRVAESDLKLAAWTGAFGKRGLDYQSMVSGNEVRFKSLRTLESGEGLTVAVAWPKGLVAQPKIADVIQRFLADNPLWSASLIALAIILAYYLVVWFMIGRDPERKAIVVEYGPPENLSPAEIRFLTAMKSDDVAFASSIINMAVKGYLRIDDEQNSYTVTKTGVGESLLTAEEAAIASKLFEDREKVAFKSENYEIILSAKRALSKHLADRFGKTFFILNSPCAMLGALLSIGVILVLYEYFSIEDIIGLAISTIISMTVITAVGAVLKVGRLKGRDKLGVFIVVLIVLVMLPVLLNVVSSVDSPVGAQLFYPLSVIAVNSLFFHLIKRRTPAGQRIQEKIIGFKRYLSLAEKDRMNFHNPPTMTPAIFERLLPYALAMGVEHEWAEIFSATVNSVGQETEYRTPSWYHSGRNFSSHSDLASGLSAMSSGITSAVFLSSGSRPGSGSAFGGGFSGGGGGFSGGGGGGGGGGGW